MDPLAAASDVAAELGLGSADDLSTAQANKVPGLLIKASSLFRRAAGYRQFTPGNFTQRLQVVDGTVRLPETPVTAVSSVKDDCGNDVRFTRDGSSLKVSGHHNTDASFGFYQPQGQGTGWFVTATYTGGDVPDEVRVAVAAAAARALLVDPTPATGVKSVENTVGPLTERKAFFDWAAESAISLSDDEIALAESYRPPAPAPIVHRSC